MRIIAGHWRGHALVAPKGLATRPTHARLRAALFDILRHAPYGGPDLFDGATVCDAFAGTGALGFEALSRGARHAVFAEQDQAALRALSHNIAALKAQARTTLLRGDLFSHRNLPACRVVFLDPPYQQHLIAPAIAHLRAAGAITDQSLIIAETARTETFNIPALTCLAERSHGAGKLWIASFGADPSA